MADWKKLASKNTRAVAYKACNTGMGDPNLERNVLRMHV